MKKFRTWYDTRIKEVAVVSETAKFVTIQEGTWPPRRTLKRSGSEDTNYFDTWQEARDFLVDREEDTLAELEKQIEIHQAVLGKIVEMKE